MDNMFGALNRFISRLDSDSNQSSSGHGLFGFQVLRNSDSQLAVEPWFDFIIGINGRQIEDPDANLFAQEVRNCAGATVTLAVWSAKGQRTRIVPIPVPKDPPSLVGLSLQWTPLSATEDVWHILEVAPNSPADQAGLLPYGDYIVGTPSGIVRGEAGLGELVEDHLSRPLDLYIYNHEYDLARLLTIHPSRHWGGDGALGCTLGYGALHRLPAPLQEPPQAPGETLFDTSSTAASDPLLTTPANDFVVPAAQVTSAPPPASNHLAPATTPKAGTEKKSRRGRAAGYSPKRAMDEYFREGEEKSRLEDRPPSTSSGKGPAPPPPPPPPSKGSTNAPSAPGTSEDSSGKQG